MIIEEFMRQVEDAGGKAFFIGGFVRDQILGIESKDRDVEIFGISLHQLKELMSRTGNFKETIVDGTFVFKFRPFLEDDDIDVSLARRERSTGPGDNDFEFESDPFMTLEDAAIRRDITINAIFQNVNGEFFDPFGGIKDLRFGIIRNISDRFVESPVRVLRVMQFAARFGFIVSQSTIDISRTMSIQTIAAERIFEEFDKMLMRGSVPSLGIRFLRDSGWIEHFPVLNDLIGCVQEFSHHPEGDVFEHTCQVIDRAAEFCARDGITGERKRAIMWSALLHDIGKPATTAIIDGKITSHGHDDIGADMARVFMNSLRAPNDLIDAVEILVREHMALLRVPAGNTRAIRRLVRRLGPVSIEDWARLLESDASGRFPKARSAPGNQFVEVARTMNIHEKINNDILMGRHLIQLGMTPGPQFKIVLDRARNAQDEEEFTDLDGAIEWFHMQMDVDNFSRVI